jgi:hypothetical protein
MNENDEPEEKLNPMTKKERQKREVEAALDGKPKPLTPLERVRCKIGLLRRRTTVGVTIRLSAEEADALTGVLPHPRFLGDVTEEFDQIYREVREFGLRQEKI